ncbi:MAG: helicase-related protein [Acidimicrobiia bacterium]|nr:helicase-related protein [Acidimicrobiia bacterium]
MTTEVLRNMIYAASRTLARVRYVVLDEVHYLQDAYRGPVWEEVIINLRPSVRLVCLSATVSNADDVAQWISSVRGPTSTVIETTRPVELDNLYMVTDRATGDQQVVPTLVDGKPNKQGSRFDTDVRTPGRGRRRRRWATPRRLEVLEELDRRDLLPVIYFVFSRVGCDEAAKATRDTGLRFTSGPERRRIGQILEERTSMLTDRDLEVLDFAGFRAGLEAGVAAHHAGMVPPFKEAVEQCFQEGLVRVVFATETLALGINMPARTVVIEKLTKFTGETHELLQPGQYTQITGRAGRRGIDDHGYAVVLWSPFVTFDRVASLAASRSFELRSAFRPTYNMAANLVRRYDPDDAHRLLAQSFAQYQADREVVRLEHAAERQRAALDERRRAATCERGDVAEYAALRDGARSRPSPRRAVEDVLARLRPGDVIGLAGDEVAAVLTAGQRGKGTRLKAVTTGGHQVNRGATDFDEPPVLLGHLDLPTPFDPGSRAYQREVAGMLRHVGPVERRGDRDRDAPAPSEAHPVHRCPDRERHLAAHRRIERLERDVERLEGRIRSRRDLLVRVFDHVLEVLESRGCLDGWALTAKGETLVNVYHECDLLVVEALDDGLFDGLEPAEVAGLASCLTYEHRSSTPPPPPIHPTRELPATHSDPRPPGPGTRGRGGPLGPRADP